MKLTIADDNTNILPTIILSTPKGCLSSWHEQCTICKSIIVECRSNLPAKISIKLINNKD